MKARVKATGEIVEVNQCAIIHDDGTREIMRGTELDEVQGAPDYWEKLHHQYAGMAMQGLLSNSAYLQNFLKYSVHGDSLVIMISTNAIDYATALVNRLKEEHNAKGNKV